MCDVCGVCVHVWYVCVVCVVCVCVRVCVCVCVRVCACVVCVMCVRVCVYGVFELCVVCVYVVHMCVRYVGGWMSVHVQKERERKRHEISCSSYMYSTHVFCCQLHEFSALKLGAIVRLSTTWLQCACHVMHASGLQGTHVVDTPLPKWLCPLVDPTSPVPPYSEWVVPQ